MEKVHATFSDGGGKVEKVYETFSTGGGKVEKVYETYRHTYIQRLTDSESHTELDRDSHRIRLSQPLTDRYKHLGRVKHRQTVTQTHSGGCMGITDKK